MTESSEVTLMLAAIQDGDSRAAEKLLPLVYDELRKLAESRLAKLPSGQTLQATALVHEAYLRLVGDADPGWNSRGHFFGAAAQAMRNILVDRARRKSRRKHGGDRRRESMSDEIALEINVPAEDILQLDAALAKLESVDPRCARVVMLRFFAGLDDEYVAEIMEVSPRTVARDWRFARSWLEDELRGGK